VVNINTYDGNVINGEAYDAGTIDLGSAESLVVPEGTIVLPVAGGGAGNRIQVYIQKRLAWSGHPAIPTDIRIERGRMGCAYRRDDTVMTLATFGSWYSKAEGGAYVTFAVEVPKDIKVEFKKGLSGLDSPVEIQEPIFDSLQSRPWHGGWQRVKDQPDKTLGGGRFNPRQVEPG
jgi:hypothetical protein